MTNIKATQGKMPACKKHNGEGIAFNHRAYSAKTGLTRQAYIMDKNINKDALRAAIIAKEDAKLNTVSVRLDQNTNKQ